MTSSKQKTPKAILVDIIDPKTSKVAAQKRLEELESLVSTFGGIVVLEVIQKRSLPDYETYIGKGKTREIINFAQESKVDFVIINNLLKPRQIFNLNEMFRKADTEVEVWDRVDLILKIFSKHAKSTQAKLQIELASIKHMGPRIFDMGIELSRQGGAVGMRAGQGESNTEMMKRHLQKQELKILEKLEHYEKIDVGHRKRRRRKNFKTISLVGYTNAGKSSLLHALTNKDVYIADQLFATLDTRVGKLYVPGSAEMKDGQYIPGQEMLIADTIGFIQDLPPSLIKAFKSTLSETVEADLLLHVVDITDPEMHTKIQVVEEILQQLKIHEKPKIYVFNKIDKINHKQLLKDHLDKEHLKSNRVRTGVLTAGKATSKELGWIHDDEEFIELQGRIKEITEKYSEHQPIFVSAHEKINLGKLVRLLSEQD